MNTAVVQQRSIAMTAPASTQILSRNWFIAGPSAVGKTLLFEIIHEIYGDNVDVLDESYGDFFKYFKNHEQCSEYFKNRKFYNLTSYSTSSPSSPRTGVVDENVYRSKIIKYTPWCSQLMAVVRADVLQFVVDFSQQTVTGSMHLLNGRDYANVDFFLKTCFARYAQFANGIVQTQTSDFENLTLVPRQSNDSIFIILDLTAAYRLRYFERRSRQFNGVDSEYEVFLYLQILAYIALASRAPRCRVYLIMDDPERLDSVFGVFDRFGLLQTCFEKCLNIRKLGPSDKLHRRRALEIISTDLRSELESKI